MTDAGIVPEQAARSARYLVGTILAIVAVPSAVAALPEWTGLMSLLWPVLVLVSHRYPAFGVALLAFTIPLQDVFWIETILGASTVTRYLGWAIIAGWLPKAVRGAGVVIDHVAVMHALIVITLVASIGAGGVRVLTWAIEVYHWLLPLAIYVACRSLGFGARDRLWVVFGIACGVIVASIRGIEQFATGAGPESYQVGGMVRVYGTFGHPNTLAAYLVLALPIMVAVSALWSKSAPPLVLWTIRGSSVLGSIALILTQSRGGWLAMAGAVGVLLWYSPRSVQRATAATVAIVAVLVVASGLATTLPGVTRFSSVIASEFNRTQVTTETWGQLERQAHWGAAWTMMTDRPIFGVGAGEYNDNFRENTTEWRFRVGRGQAHNGYLHMGAQAGVPGMLAFTAWVGTILGALRLRMQFVRGPDRVLLVGALATAVAFTIESIFEYLEVLSLPVLFLVVVAIGMGGQGRGDVVSEPSGMQRATGDDS